MKTTSKIKKILFVGPYPPPYGGIATHLYDLLPLLSKNGYEVMSLTPALINTDLSTKSSSGILNIQINLKKYFFKNLLYILISCFKVLKYARKFKMNGFLRNVVFAIAISNIIRKKNIDAIFIYTINNGMTIPIIKKFIKKTPKIALMIFGAFYLEPEKYKGMADYIEEIFKNCDIILSSSKYCADSIKSVLGFNFPCRVIYVGVDDKVILNTSRFEFLVNEYGIPDNAIVLFFLGRMTKDMGLDFLLKNVEEILKIDPNTYLIISGAKGDLSSEVEALANMNRRVKYCPNIPNEKKIYYFSYSDIVLAPTMEKHACMGVSIKEAMACGKPVIASNSGGISEAIDDGVNGFLVPFVNNFLDKEVFLDKLKILVKDQQLRLTMGEKGHEKLMNYFTNNQTLKNYFEVLDFLSMKTF